MRTLDNETLKKRLRYQGKQYESGNVSRGGSGQPHMLTEAADRIEELEQELAGLTERLAVYNRKIVAQQAECDLVRARMEHEAKGHAKYRVKCDDIEQQAACEILLNEELRAELESETKVANSLRMVCKRNNELLKEIAELQEKLKEEDKEWRNAFEVSEHDKDILNARWGYIKTDIEGARALLILLRDGKGTPDDFDTMVDRIIESRKVAGL